MNRFNLFAFGLLLILSLAGMSTAATHEIAITGYAFVPNSMNVTTGDTVRWTNNDAAPHTVTASDNSFDSGYMAQHATFTWVFSAPGTVSYSCLYHPSMTAEIVIQDPPGEHTQYYHEVAISGFAFQPSDITIAIGDTVNWTNNDSSPHTVTATGGSFDSGNMPMGATFMYVFASAGDFPYVCSYHSNMTAVVHVAAPPMLYDVAISGFQFQPAELHIAIGDSVRWTNNDSTPHTATATNGEFDSGNLNTGQTFTHAFAMEGSYTYVCNYHTNMTGVIVVGNPTGGESDWVELSSPTTLPLTDIRFWDASLGWASGEQGILRTTDGGDTWSIINTANDVEALYFISMSEGWACGNNGMILHSTNGGQSWQPQTSGVNDKLRDIWFADAMNGWAVGRNGILIHTSNGGVNWLPQTNPAVDDLRGIHMLDAQRGWVSGSDGLILYTTNGGAAWTPQLSVPGGEEDEFEAVYALDETHAWAAGGQGRIYYTTDGQNWNAQTSGTTVALQDIFFPTATDGWVCGSGAFLGRWDNDMQMWMPQIAPAITTFNAIYFVNEFLGFTVTGDGRIFRYEIIQNAVTPGNSAVPSRSALYANYPNPFNPSTTIQFDLNSAMTVRLDVYDVLGQLVSTLVDGTMSAGTHQVQFSGSDLPTGIYFYQLRAADQVMNRRMILIK